MKINLAILMILLSAFVSCGGALARGGGGGGRGGGGGFGRGDMGGFAGDRGYGDRGYGDRGYGDRSSDFGGDGTADDRGFRDDGPLSRVTESQLESGADKVYGSGLATDGMRAAPARAINSGGTTRNMSDAYLTSRGADIRGSFKRYDAFRPAFWANHRDGFWYRGWGDGYAWDNAGWSDLAGYWGIPLVDAPTDYDYGDNITYDDNNVYYGSQPVATVGDYYVQAQNLAVAPPDLLLKNGQPANTGTASSWRPLGVYSLSQNGEPSTTMFMLTVNKDGVIRGDFYDSLTEEQKPVKGKVDKKSMRAAWMIQGNSNIIYEAGLSNLLHPQCTALVHKGKNKTEQWLMVRQQSQK